MSGGVLSSTRPVAYAILVNIEKRGWQQRQSPVELSTATGSSTSTLVHAHWSPKYTGLSTLVTIGNTLRATPRALKATQGRLDA